MPAVKISALFEQMSNWHNFAAHFYNYKICSELPGIFGRGQYYRTAALGDAANDFWLIYAYDTFRDEYLLLTVTGPDAHNRGEWGSFLRTIQCEIVEPWMWASFIFLT